MTRLADHPYYQLDWMAMPKDERRRRSASIRRIGGWLKANSTSPMLDSPTWTMFDSFS